MGRSIVFFLLHPLSIDTFLLHLVLLMEQHRRKSGHLCQSFQLQICFDSETPVLSDILHLHTNSTGGSTGIVRLVWGRTWVISRDLAQCLYTSTSLYFAHTLIKLILKIFLTLLFTFQTDIIQSPLAFTRAPLI